jgi:hypothetical protein
VVDVRNDRKISDQGCVCHAGLDSTRPAAAKGARRSVR